MNTPSITQRLATALEKVADLRPFLLGWQLSDGCRRNEMEAKVQQWIDGIGELFEAAQPPAPAPQCAGDPGECAHNGACMWACGRSGPPAAEMAGEPMTAARVRIDRVSHILRNGGTVETERVIKLLEDCRAQLFHAARAALTPEAAHKAGQEDQE